MPEVHYRQLPCEGDSVSPLGGFLTRFTTEGTEEHDTGARMGGCLAPNGSLPMSGVCVSLEKRDDRDELPTRHS